MFNSGQKLLIKDIIFHFMEAVDVIFRIKQPLEMMWFLSHMMRAVDLVVKFTVKVKICRVRFSINNNPIGTLKETRYLIAIFIANIMRIPGIPAREYHGERAGYDFQKCCTLT